MTKPLVRESDIFFILQVGNGITVGQLTEQAFSPLIEKTTPTKKSPNCCLIQRNTSGKSWRLTLDFFVPAMLLD
jgi:hypothetical protein